MSRGGQPPISFPGIVNPAEASWPMKCESVPFHLEVNPICRPSFLQRECKEEKKREKGEERKKERKKGNIAGFHGRGSNSDETWRPLSLLSTLYSIGQPDSSLPSWTRLNRMRLQKTQRRKREQSRHASRCDMAGGKKRTGCTSQPNVSFSFFYFIFYFFTCGKKGVPCMYGTCFTNGSSLFLTSLVPHKSSPSRPSLTHFLSLDLSV